MVAASGETAELDGHGHGSSTGRGLDSEIGGPLPVNGTRRVCVWFGECADVPTTSRARIRSPDRIAFSHTSRTLRLAYHTLSLYSDCLWPTLHPFVSPK